MIQLKIKILVIYIIIDVSAHNTGSIVTRREMAVVVLLTNIFL